MTLPPLIIFDLDETLTESKEPLTRAMAHLVEKLLERTRVAVISGGALPQFLKQIVARLPSDAPLERLYLLPTAGAALYTYRDGGWDKVYEERISETDAAQIQTAIDEGAAASGVIDFAEATWGPRTEYRGSSIAFSALGQEAPVAEKKAWDPSKAKRRALQKEIAARLPKGFTAEMGGSTTIDILKRGVNKAYGLRQLAARLGVPEPSILYVGDELVAHGNDEAVFDTGAKTAAVKNPTDTARLIGKLLGSHDSPA